MATCSTRIIIRIIYYACLHDYNPIQEDYFAKNCSKCSWNVIRIIKNHMKCTPWKRSRWWMKKRQDRTQIEHDLCGVAAALLCDAFVIPLNDVSCLLTMELGWLPTESNVRKDGKRENMSNGRPWLCSYLCVVWLFAIFFIRGTFRVASIVWAVLSEEMPQTGMPFEWTI